MSKKKIDVLNGSVYAVLLGLSWPTVVSNLLQTIYNITDAFWLGKLGKVELAAPTVAFPIIFVFISLSSGFSIAASALVSQHTGARQKSMAELVATQCVSASVVVSGLVAVLGVLLARRVMSIMTPDPQVQELATTYMQIISVSSPFMFIFLTSSSILRAWGDAKTPMHFAIFSVVLNVVLDPLMIFGWGFPRMGVAGAAMATLIARATVALYSLGVLFGKRHEFSLHLKYLLPRWNVIRKILAIGLPSSLGDAFTALGFAFIMSVVARFGTAVTSAYGVGNRVISMITMFSAAVSMAVATMVGQFLGGDMVDKAKETLLKAAVVTFLIVGTICSLLFFYGEWITRFFITNPDVVQYGRTFFRYVSFSVPFFAVMNVLLGAFRGSGHTVQLTFINLLRLWGIRIPLVVLMSSSLGVRGVFIAMIISNILALAVTVVFLSNGKWAQKLI